MNKIIYTVSKKIPVSVLVFSLLYLLIIIMSFTIPMFWDMSYISRISNLVYDSRFSVFIYNITDNGASPLYSIYVALLWKIFGKSLLVSHIAILPFTTGIIYYFYKISLRFIDKKYIPIALLLLFIEPTIITQTILAGDDVLYCFLFLFGLNSVFENKRILIALSMLLIPVLNLRGFSIVFSLLFFDIYINFSKGKWRELTYIILTYIPSFVILVAWLFNHYETTGWFAVSSYRERYHHLNGLNVILRNIVYIVWKIIDFGRVIPALFILLFFINTRKNKDSNGITLFLIMVFSVLPYFLFFLPLTYPVSHRHFMITYIIGIIFFTYGISFIKQRLLKVTILSLTFFSLLAGNFITYPERYGNGWDSSLKMLPYFGLKKQLDNYLVNSAIAPAMVGTKFPLDFDNYDCYLNGEHFALTDMDKKPYKEFPFIVQSNISNTFTPEEMETLNSKWKLVKELKAWPVYIKVFKNPDK